MARRLTLKQEAFVKEYVANGGNGTQAALKVYDINSDNPASIAKSIASENLTIPHVQSALERLKDSVCDSLTPAMQVAIARAKSILNDDTRSEEQHQWASQYLLQVLAVSKGNTEGAKLPQLNIKNAAFYPNRKSKDS